MRVKFFLIKNNDVNSQPTFSIGLSYQERTEQQLQTQLHLLKNYVDEAARCPNDLLPVVLCGEDFFQGGSLSSDEECEQGLGQCLHQNTAFNFIAHELSQLSQTYPKVLIIPGSMYVSVTGPESGSHYQQNGGRRSGSLFTQSLLPVLFGGEVIRLIKKGGLLVNKQLKKEMQTFSEVVTGMNSGHNFSVPHYYEDDLEDINPGLVFFGETPLPGEEGLLALLGLEHVRSSPCFIIKGMKFGIEICADHHRKSLAGEHLDYHLISSDGVSWSYSACDEYGYRVQADAESPYLTSLIENHSESRLTLTPKVAEDEKARYYESEPLHLNRHQVAINSIANLIKESTLLASKSSPTMFKQLPRIYLDLDLIIQKFEGNNCSACTCLQDIITTCENLDPGNCIQTFATQLLNTLRNHEDSLHSSLFKPINPSSSVKNDG